MLLSLLLGTALAGELVVDSSVPVDVRARGASLISVLSSARVRVTDVPPGSQVLELSRGGKTQSLTVVVPDQGAALITINEKGGFVESGAAPPSPSPSVELHAPRDQRFATIVDGERVVAWSGAYPVVLESLKPGARAIELRSTDLLTIWARGTLDLEPSDRLVLTVSAGRSMDVAGRAGAFRPYTGESAAPTPGN